MTSTQPEAALAVPRELPIARLRPHLPLAALLAFTAVLYLWGLSRLGWANDYYAAAAQAGTESWRAFFFGSLDPSNYITVDKPPASLWLMELSTRLFGLSSFSMLLPQALAGVASVALVYAAVRRWFSREAALLSGLVLAVTPVAALMFRYNHPDALLVLLFVAAAYAVTRALERASTLWLALAGAAVGLGFLTKMLQAFLVLPAFALVYLVAAPTPLRRRVWQAVVAGAALVVAGGWWVAAVELTPASARPYIGGSTDNSVLDLIWGYNGLGRIDGGGGGAGGGFSGSPGLLRLFNPLMGGQIAWLLPAALVVLAAGLVWTWRRPRTDRTRAALLLWGGWLVVTGAVFSFMSGIIHPYYTNTLAPPIAVLTGVGAVELRRRRGSLAARALLAGLVLTTAIWSWRLLGRTPDWHPALRTVILFGGIAVALALLALTARSAPAVAAAALAIGLAGPVAFTLSTVASASTGPLVSAGPITQAGMVRAMTAGAPPPRAFGAPLPGGFGGRPPGAPTGGPGRSSVSASPELVRLLKQDASSYTWVAATGSSMTAAPLQLATGKAVMAIGGFNGGDPAMTLARFKALVAAGRIHYYVGGGAFGGPDGGRAAASEIETWVSSTFESTVTGSGATVYDLTS